MKPDHESPFDGMEPILSALDRPSAVDPPAAGLRRLMEAFAPLPLKRRALEGVLLGLLKEQGGDGLELLDRLKARGLRYEAEGEAAFYGVLHHLEAEGWIAARWRESSHRMVKTYHVTPKGTDRLDGDAQAMSLLARRAATG